MSEQRKRSDGSRADQEPDVFEYKLAYAGLPVRPRSKAMLCLRRLLDVHDFASFDAAVGLASGMISLNFSFASVDGHIGTCVYACTYIYVYVHICIHTYK